MQSAFTNFSPFTTLAAANNLAPDLQGNGGIISGNTQINLISNVGRPAGSTLTLVFTGIPLIKNAQATSGTNQIIRLNGEVDFQVAVGCTLCLYNDGTSWVETSRKELNDPSLVDYQVFTANGTWTKPTWFVPKRIRVECIGGGGSGGGPNPGSPGTGGGGGAYVERWFQAATCGTAETVVVGVTAPGLVGDGVGITGSFSSFGSLCKAFGGGPGMAGGGGGGGGGGTHSAAGEPVYMWGGTGGGGLVVTNSGTIATGWGNGGCGGFGANSPVGQTTGSGAPGWGGGGGGGHERDGGTSLFGGGGGGGGYDSIAAGVGGQSGGTVSGQSGGGGAAGTDGANGSVTGACGCGGGGGVASGVAGHGGVPGGGGGGGATSGTASGNGARGEVRVTTYG